MTTKNIKSQENSNKAGNRRTNFENLFLIIILVLIGIFCPFTYLTYEMLAEYIRNKP